MLLTKTNQIRFSSIPNEQFVFLKKEEPLFHGHSEQEENNNARKMKDAAPVIWMKHESFN